MSRYEALEKQLRQWLKAGKKITVEWDCGGDEGLVFPFIDGVELPYDAPLGEDFYNLLMNKLGLPSAGEYYVKGEGKIILEDEEIVIYHESEASGWEDGDYEEWADEYYWEGERPEFYPNEEEDGPFVSDGKIEARTTLFG